MLLFLWIFFALDKNGQAFYPRTPWTDGSPLTRIKRGTLGMTTKPSNKLESKFESSRIQYTGKKIVSVFATLYMQ